MSIIKIPSSNIYGIGNDISLIRNNKKPKCTVEVNDFQENKGNILSPEYVIHFWETPQQQNVAPIVFKGASEKINNVIFDYYTSGDTSYEYGYAKIKNIISRFKTDKTLLLDYDYNDVINGGYLVKGYNTTMEAYVLRHEYIEGETETPSTYFETITYSLSDLRYYPEDNTFWAILANGKLPSDSDPIRIYEYFKSSSSQTWHEWWLIYATIKVEGMYYVPQKNNRAFGVATSKNDVVQLPSNELVQSETFIKEEDKKTSLLDNVLENVASNYSMGKEVYEIKCSLANYYDTNGNLVICPTDTSYPACFKKHDIVEPYVFTSKGEVPLSTKSDGTPKRFEIIGVDFSYKGVVWQTLTIQEKDTIYIPPTTTINFTIENKPYIADKGMTWKQWVASSYNIDGYEYDDIDVEVFIYNSLDGKSYFVANADGISVVEDNNTEIVAGDYILEECWSITFTIDGTTYSAQKGMPWNAWCDTIGYQYGFYTDVFVTKNDTYYVVDANGKKQQEDDKLYSWSRFQLAISFTILHEGDDIYSAMVDADTNWGDYIMSFNNSLPLSNGGTLRTWGSEIFYFDETGLEMGMLYTNFDEDSLIGTPTNPTDTIINGNTYFIINS